MRVVSERMQVRTPRPNLVAGFSMLKEIRDLAVLAKQDGSAKTYGIDRLW
jgi:hypothetical protein